MRSASIRIVKRNNVTGPKFDLFESSSDCEGHRAEVYGHVIALGNDTTGTIKDGAGVIPTLFDVW
jgi:hypothetical protein